MSRRRSVQLPVCVCVCDSVILYVIFVPQLFAHFVEIRNSVLWLYSVSCYSASDVLHFKNALLV